MIIILLVLAALTALVLLFILAAAALAGGCTGAALGSLLPLVFDKPVLVKGVPQPDPLGKVLRGALGFVVGGISGSIIGLVLAGLAIWALSVLP
jgi:hypothetical protein